MTCLRVGIALVAACAGLPAVPAHAQSAPAAPAVTFTEHVAPILFARCISCHRTGEMGPMSLATFAETRPWARAIRTAVLSRAMPPWGADPHVGAFANDPRLSDADVSTIVRWADGGAAEGPATQLPALPPRVEGWTMGTPDLVLTMQPFDIPPSNTSVIRDLPLSKTFDHDTLVQAAEVRPGVRAITHHANVLVPEGDGTNRVASFSPGEGGKRYPAGVAKLIPKGTPVALNMHYNPRGQASRDPGTIVGLQFATGPVRQIAYTAEAGTHTLDIPPGAANFAVVGQPFVFEEDTHILSLMPRMNERGKDFSYTLMLPDGTSRVLLSVPAWNIDWVFTYTLKEPVAAPKGSRLETLAHFDNSAGNKANPDPTARVKYGPEIMNGYFEYTRDAQDLTTSAIRPRH